jgi:hypothetical protein
LWSSLEVSGETGKGGRSVRVEEIEDLFHEVKAALEAGKLTDHEFEDKIRSLLFRDDDGNYWTVGAQTEKWYRYEEGEWIQDSPPPALERAEAEESAPRGKAEETTSKKKRRVDRPLAIGLGSIVFVACLLLAAVAAYQLGKISSVARDLLPGLTPSVEAVESPTIAPLDSPTLAETPTAAGAEPSSPVPEATPTQPSPTATRPPTSTPVPSPTATIAPTPVLIHAAPVLSEPEDGAERGPGYYAVLMWKPVPGLGEDEYYHIEVCWNDCKGREACYTRDTTWTFPDFRRGQAVDTRYYWKVTVRRQQGEEPAGPADPPTSPASETWSFMLPER